MPSMYVHALHALRARTLMDSAAQAVADADRTAFLLGTLGPDPYIGDAFPPPLLRTKQTRLGEWLHAADMRTVAPTLLRLSENDPAYAAYALGFLCHYALDRTLHPFIDAMSGGGAWDHIRYELHMDLIVRDRANEPSLFARPEKLFGPRAAQQKADALHAAFFAVWRGEKTQGAFARSCHKYIRLYELSYDPNGGKYAFCKTVERPFRKQGKLSGLIMVNDLAESRDLFNAQKKPWSSPATPEIRQTESYQDLFTAAVRHAAELCTLSVAAMQNRGGYDAVADACQGSMNGDPI